MEYILVHGSGQKSSSWNETKSYLTKINNISCPDIFSLIDGNEATYENVYSAFVKYCDNFSGKINLCGLSLGGILSLNYAIDYPEKLNTLILVCTPYKIKSLIYNIQTIIFRLLPKSFYNRFGIKKEDMIKLAVSMKNLDFSNSLDKVKCMTLIICGSKDSINLKSAKYLSENIENTDIRIIEKTGHVINEENPKALAMELESFFQNLP